MTFAAGVSRGAAVVDEGAGAGDVVRVPLAQRRLSRATPLTRISRTDLTAGAPTGISRDDYRQIRRTGLIEFEVRRRPGRFATVASPQTAARPLYGSRCAPQTQSGDKATQ